MFPASSPAAPRNLDTLRRTFSVSDPAITAVLTCWPDGVISHRSAAQHHGISRVARPDQPQWAASRAWVHQRAKVLSNGRGGVTLLREATARDAAARFNSWLERAASHVYRAGGLPDSEWNVRVRDARGLIGIVDALWPQWMVVSEKEGLRFHTTPSQRRRDAQRFKRLLDADYRARRFTWEDVTQQPLHVVETLYRALRAAGADLDPARIPRKIDVPQPSVTYLR